MSASGSPDVTISAEQRARELRMLDGIAAMLDLAALATRHSADPGFTAQNHQSVVKVLATASDMLEMVRAEMATVMRGVVR